METTLQATEIRNIFERKGCKNFIKLFDTGFKGTYVVLRILRDANGALSAGDLAKETNISTARIAVIIKVLLDKKHITRVQSACDGRKVAVEITPDGVVALEQRELEIQSMIEQFLRKLTDDETENLIFLLKKMFN